MSAIALPPCGYTCHDCQYYQKECSGCTQTCGKPFWIKDESWEVCPIYGCCCDKKGLEHCGLCPKLPCEIFLTLRDPDMTDEEFENSLKQRLNVLRNRESN